MSIWAIQETCKGKKCSVLALRSLATQLPFLPFPTHRQGKSPEECSLCPRGKYADFEGATATAECVRCPAGKFADEEGMKDCLCITPSSCNLEFLTPEGKLSEQFYIPIDGISVDYMRETVPYIGNARYSI